MQGTVFLLTYGKPMLITMAMAFCVFVHRATLVSSSNPPSFVDVCHEGGINNINENALATHLAHGDVQLIDKDGDGYYTEWSPCSALIDCDDDDPLITACATISVGAPHPTYGGLVFEVDGFGGGKLINCVPLTGMNFGYIDIQHAAAWTSSRTDGGDNTDLLLAVHPNFDPVVTIRSHGPEWYMPAIDEVILIHNVLFSTGIASLEPGYYLSSTDSGNAKIKAYHFHLSYPYEIDYSHYGLGAYVLRARTF